jgi:hypothetical protein
MAFIIQQPSDRGSLSICGQSNLPQRLIVDAWNGMMVQGTMALVLGRSQEWCIGMSNWLAKKQNKDWDFSIASKANHLWWNACPIKRLSVVQQA